MPDMVVLDNPMVSATLRDNVLIARVRCSNINQNEHQALQTYISDLCKKYSHRIVLDLTEVLLVGSCGLSVFIVLSKEAAAGKGALALTHLAPDLVQLLRITHLLKMFKIYNTVDEAVNAIK